MRYIPTIGLEIHCQLKTNSKMFCRCPVGETDQPNVNICPICTGQPGVLPKINKQALDFAIKVALALNCQIQEYAEFARKHYFYPDLPKNYQISQYQFPIGRNGFLMIETKQGLKNIKIERVHIEEDTAKLLHAGDGYSLVDFNRAGSPLLEIVTEPDISSPQEAKIFIQQLQTTLRYLGVSDADMEKGHLRVDANISLRKDNEKKLGTKTEIKNLNSFKALERALMYEIERQTEILKEGKKVIQETRGWSEAKQKTLPQRSKEQASDYRYFPEPDLPPLIINEKWIEKIKSEIGELPLVKKQRFEKEYLLSSDDAQLIVSDVSIANFFENTYSELLAWLKASGIKDYNTLQLSKLVASWIRNEIFKILNEKKISFEEIKITSENFAEFLILILKGTINNISAKKIFHKMIKENKDPSVILEEEGLHLINDFESLESIADKVLKENPQVIEDYKKGKTQAIQFLIGKVMAETKGSADPNIVRQILEKMIK